MARKETDRKADPILKKLRFGVASFGAQTNHIQSASAPVLQQAASVESIGDHLVARLAGMIPTEVGRCERIRESAFIANFQTVIVKEPPART